MFGLLHTPRFTQLNTISKVTSVIHGLAELLLERVVSGNGCLQCFSCTDNAPNLSTTELCYTPQSAGKVLPATSIHKQSIIQLRPLLLFHLAEVFKTSMKCCIKRLREVFPSPPPLYRKINLHFVQLSSPGQIFN